MDTQATAQQILSSIQTGKTTVEVIVQQMAQMEEALDRGAAVLGLKCTPEEAREVIRAVRAGLAPAPAAEATTTETHVKETHMAHFVIRNDFHGSEVTLSLPQQGGVLSAGQVRKARRALCGMAGCTCGGLIGERGPQSAQVIAMPHGAMLRPWPPRRGTDEA